MIEEVEVVLQELRAVLAAVEPKASEALYRGVRSARRVFTAGMGRSGLVAKAFAQRLAHLGLDARAYDEITLPRIGKGDLLVAASGSGETPSTLLKVKLARSAGARVALVTARPRSAIGRLASVLVHIPAPSRVWRDQALVGSVQPGRSLFEQALLVYLDALVLRLMEEEGIEDDDVMARHSNLD